MSRGLFTPIIPLGLLAVTFCLLNCHAMSVGEDGEEQLPEPIEYLGDCSNQPKEKESCEDICGESSCRNRQQENSSLPLEHFCFCHKTLPQNGASHHCHPETENSTMRDECQMTCYNVFDPEGNEYSDYYCSSQNPQTRSSEEHCICVASSSIPQLDYDSDNVMQNPRAGNRGKGKRPTNNNRPTNQASCTNVDGNSQAAINCPVGSCYAICPDSAVASFRPQNNNNNGNNAPGAIDYHVLENNSFVVG